MGAWSVALTDDDLVELAAGRLPVGLQETARCVIAFRVRERRATAAQFAAYCDQRVKDRADEADRYLGDTA